MVDLSDKGSTGSEQMMSSNCGIVSSSSSSSSERAKTCADCGTTKTPLWRGGPAGPKSLCNACGIRSRKKRRALLGLNKSSTEHKKPKKINNPIIISNTESDNNSSLQDSTKSKFLAFPQPMTWQRTKVRRKLGEEERAAMLLMALSCRSIYA